MARALNATSSHVTATGTAGASVKGKCTRQLPAHLQSINGSVAKVCPVTKRFTREMRFLPVGANESGAERLPFAPIPDQLPPTHKHLVLHIVPSQPFQGRTRWWHRRRSVIHVYEF